MISGLPVSVLVFIFSSLSLEVIVLISLKLELEESCYYEPDSWILTSPIKHEKVVVSFSSNKSYKLSLVSVSENYMTLIPVSKEIEVIREDFLEGAMIIRGKKYFFRAKNFLEKRPILLF